MITINILTANRIHGNHPAKHPGAGANDVKYPLMEILLATNNRHKAAEIARIVAPVRVLCLADLDLAVDLSGVEDGATYEENALKKARPVAAAAPRAIVVADDSGLEVDALDGRPGLHSARYGGDGPDAKRYELLLGELSGVPPARRAARFICIAAAVFPGGAEYIFKGVREGIITERPRGEGGFGYDPVFLVPETGRTMAELTPDEKNRISHRGIAFRLLRDTLLRTSTA